MRPLITLLIILFLVLQYNLWFGRGSVRTALHLKHQTANFAKENAALEQRNAIIAADVNALKQNKTLIEKEARQEFGMVKQGETFYQVVSVGVKS